MNISCHSCGESDELLGSREDDKIDVTCRSCGYRWVRDLSMRCDRCLGDDMQTIPLAIIEKGRGTQLSVVGTRPIHLCSVCDAEVLRSYHDHRPNPLMPTELPTIDAEGHA